jgi:hypothetical protein
MSNEPSPAACRSARPMLVLWQRLGCIQDCSLILPRAGFNLKPAYMWSSQCYCSRVSLFLTIIIIRDGQFFVMVNSRRPTPRLTTLRLRSRRRKLLLLPWRFVVTTAATLAAAGRTPN